MNLPEYLLDLPAEEAARLIALALLDRAAGAARRLADPTDPTALHDFRVATRRLRSCLQAYRPEIGRSIPGRLRRRLARLAGATRRSRDLEVHLAWARAQEPGLGERQQAGLRWHLDRLEHRRRRADRRLSALVGRDFGRLDARYRHRLQRYRLVIEREPSRRRLEAAGVIGGRIRQLAGDLECRLAAIRTETDETPAHRARLAAKRLRYLLEPIRSDHHAAERLLTRLGHLQEVLGTLQDSRVQRVELARGLEAAGREHARRLHASIRSRPGVEVALAQDPRPGLLALIGRLESREVEAFDQLRAEWLAGAAEPFFQAITALGEALAHRPACVAETERRFLLRRLPATARALAVQDIEQGWLPGARVVERIRSLRAADAAATYRTSAWTGSDSAGRRSAWNGEVDERVFSDIWPLTAGRRITKRRHVVPDYGLRWEIDQFLDRDLVIAEVAVDGADALVMPEWLQPYLVREVTGERDYTSHTLAR